MIRRTELYSSLKDHALRLLLNRPHSPAEMAFKLRRLVIHRGYRKARREEMKRRRAAKRGWTSFPSRDVKDGASGSSDDEEYVSPDDIVRPIDTDAVVDEVIAFLEEEDHASYEEYARWHVEQRARNRPRSALVLKAELAQKSVPPSMVEAVLGELYDETAACRQLAQSAGKARTPVELTKYLLNKGFPHTTVKSAVSELDETDDSG